MFTRIEQYLVGALQGLRLPGLAIAIVQGERVIYLSGFGKADLTGRPITPQTPFIIGSLSKSFTALAIMQLVEAGRIELDAPVQRYLPWFRIQGGTASSQMTVRHLLTHTSGISRYVGRQLLAAKGAKTKEQRVRELSRVSLTKPVGTAYQYSNTNYLILGLLIEAASSQPYESYIQQHIFTPLQMNHSFTSEGEARRDGIAVGYRWWFGFPLPASVPYLADALPAAFLISSAEDMAHYLIAHLNGGRYSGVSLLSPAGIAELHRPQAEITAGNAYAMGWHVESHDGVTLLRHGGETANWRGEMVLLPERQIGIVLLANANNGLVAQLGLDRIAPGVVRLLLREQPPKNRLTFKLFYAALDVVLFVPPVLQVRSLRRLAQRSYREVRLKRRQWITQMALCLTELVLPMSLYKRIPKWADAPWPLLRLYVPDLTSWLSGMLALSFVTSITRGMRLVLWFAGRRRQYRKRKIHHPFF